MFQHHFCPGNPLEGQTGLIPFTSTKFDPNLGPHGLIFLILRELIFQRLSISNPGAAQSAQLLFCVNENPSSPLRLEVSLIWILLWQSTKRGTICLLVCGQAVTEAPDTAFPAASQASLRHKLISISFSFLFLVSCF